MSDLDADLYSDLYGNDDDGFTAVTEPSKDGVKTEFDDAPEELTPLPSPSVDTKPELPAVPAAATTGQSGIPAKPTAALAPPPAAAKLPPPPIGNTQPIQTYQQNQYDEPPAPRQNFGGAGAGAPGANAAAGAQVLALGDRPVRPSEMKDEGKMFIGGLNWDTTDDTLRNYFTQFGKVDACTIMRDAGGRSRCFAFLTFDDPASVNAVMVREHVLDGKIIDPKRAIPRQEHQRATKLFIGGLAGSVTSESMREFFSQFGRVVDSTVMLDRETGRSKGFGFVSLEDVDVSPILGFGNLEIDGKMIDVKLAQPRHQRDTFQENGGAPGGFVGGAGRGNGEGAYMSAGPKAPAGNAFGGVAAPVGGAGVGGAGAGTPFDPQALAALYTRMFQVNGGMNPMMGAGMGGGGMGMPGGMGGMGMGGMGMGGMGMGMGGMGMGMPGGGGGMGMGGMGGMGRGGGMGGGMGGRGGGGMGMGATPMGMGAGGPMGNVPRGPRGAGGGAAPMAGGGMGMGAGGPGPQRTGQRGQHNYHPYARG